MPLGESIEPSLIVALCCQDTTQCLILSQLAQPIGMT